MILIQNTLTSIPFLPPGVDIRISPTAMLQAWQEEAVQPSLDVSVLPRVDTGHVARAASQYWHNNISLFENWKL